MASVFSKIIAGEIPGRFAWVDETCVVMSTIEPVREGHVMVVPRVETDKWTDIPAADFAHMANVAQIVGKAQEAAFGVPRAVTMILGFEVPHAHIHVVPATDEGAGTLHGAKQAEDSELEAAMVKLREALVAAGHGEHVPADMRSAAL